MYFFESVLTNVYFFSVLLLASYCKCLVMSGSIFEICKYDEGLPLNISAVHR